MSLPDDLFAKYMDVFLSKILQHFSEEEIILVDVRCIRWYLDETHSYVYYDDSGNDLIENKRILRGFNYIKEKLRNVHVIDSLPNFIGDDVHKWGRHNLHYTRESYDYIYSCIISIVEAKNRLDESVRLHKLKDKYESIMNKKYYDEKGWFLGYKKNESMLHTYHGTVLNYNRGKGLIYHDYKVDNPLQIVFVKGDEVYLYLPFQDEYIVDINSSSMEVRTGKKPKSIVIEKKFNRKGGALGVLLGGMYLSARKSGECGLQIHCREWECFKIPELIPGNDASREIDMTYDKVSNIKTFHGTRLFYDLKLNRIVHNKINLLVDEYLPINFASFDEDKCSFVIFISGKMHYIELEEEWKLVTDRADALYNYYLSDDGYISIDKDGKYFSARDDGTFSLVGKKNKWEEFQFIY